MLLVYAEAFSMIHLTIIIATSHVVGGKVSFSQVTICMPKGILEIAMSLSDIIFLFTFFLLDNVIYMFVTNNQSSVLISKISRQVIPFHQVPHFLYGFEISLCNVNSIASKCYLANLPETGRIQTKNTPYMNIISW